MKQLVVIQELLFIRCDAGDWSVDDQSAPGLWCDVSTYTTQPWPDSCFSQVPIISPDFTLGRGTYSFFFCHWKQTGPNIGKIQFSRECLASVWLRDVTWSVGLKSYQEWSPRLPWVILQGSNWKANEKDRIQAKSKSLDSGQYSEPFISLLWTCQGHRPQCWGWAVIWVGGESAGRRLGLRSNITLKTSSLNPDPKDWVEPYRSWRIIRGRYESGWKCAQGQMCADGARLWEGKKVESDGVSPRK